MTSPSQNRNRLYHQLMPHLVSPGPHQLDRTGGAQDSYGFGALGMMQTGNWLMHDIIGDIVDWDEANKVYLAAEGATGERYNQRLEAAGQMAEIEARWQHLLGGFHGQRRQIKTHIQAVAETTQVTSREDLCWLAIAAASAWLPNRAPVEASSRLSLGHDQCSARTPDGPAAL
jgi:hypothetical protein